MPRRWARPASSVRRVALLAVLAVVASGCSGGSSDGAAPADGGSSTTVSSSSAGQTTSVPDTVPSPERTCGGIEGETAWLDVEGVGRIQMATIGSGDTVAVLLHQAQRNGMCGWVPYAERLATQGVRSILVNQCGYGATQCTEAVGVGETWPVVAAAAVAHAHAGDARRVTLVGASAGGTLAVVAAGRSADAPDGSGIDALVSLSGPVTYGDLDAGAAAGSVTQQALVVTAPDDASGPTPEQATALVAAMASTDKRVLVADDQPGVHGWDLLGTDGDWEGLADTVQQVVLGD